MSTFHQRKRARTEYFERHVKGWKLRPCVSCSGSGRYDHQGPHGSPPCGACSGTGRERYRPQPEGGAA